MSQMQFTKLSAETAAEICGQFELGDEAMPLLRDDHTPAAFFALLLEGGHHVDATRFMASALPKRRAVWWACICVRSVLDEDPAPEMLAPLEAAEKWVRTSNDDNRRAAMAAAEAAGFDSGASWAAVAAFWSEGSMAPPDVPPVDVPDDLCAKAVAGAIMLAAVAGDAEQAPDRYKAFLGHAADLASGSTDKPASGRRAG